MPASRRPDIFSREWDARFAASASSVEAGAPLESRGDRVTVEEPLEIRVGANAGCDDAHARTRLRARGGLASSPRASSTRPEEIVRIEHCREVRSPEEEGNVVIVRADRARRATRWIGRAGCSLTSSSCGLCGKGSIESIRGQLPGAWPPTRRGLGGRPDGAARHAAAGTGIVSRRRAAFTPPGSSPSTERCVASREDVGRHNAVDKVIGHPLPGGPRAALRGDPARFGTGVLRDRPEGRGRGHPDPRRRVGALIARHRSRPRLARRARGLPARRRIQSLFGGRAGLLRARSMRAGMSHPRRTPARRAAPRRPETPGRSRGRRGRSRSLHVAGTAPAGPPPPDPEEADERKAGAALLLAAVVSRLAVFLWVVFSRACGGP